MLTKQPNSRRNLDAEPGGNRPHDLIDLQVMISEGGINYLKTKETCARLFAYRDLQK